MFVRLYSFFLSFRSDQIVQQPPKSPTTTTFFPQSSKKAIQTSHSPTWELSLNPLFFLLLLLLPIQPATIGLSGLQSLHGLRQTLPHPVLALNKARQIQTCLVSCCCSYLVQSFAIALCEELQVDGYLRCSCC